MTHFQHELSEQPFIGFLFSAFFYTIGLLSNVLLFELPLIIMQLFQISAWATGIFVGCITIFEWIKKNKFFKKR